MQVQSANSPLTSVAVRGLVPHAIESAAAAAVDEPSSLLVPPKKRVQFPASASWSVTGGARVATAGVLKNAPFVLLHIRSGSTLMFIFVSGK